MNAENDLNTKKPKKILALDGGGIRGLISIKVLERLETLLRQETGEPEYRLAEYFDFVAGTSTGAIIAAGIATGMSMSDIRHLYFTNAEEMFTPHRFPKNIIYSKYRHKKLEDIFKRTFQEEDGQPMCLGSSRIRTGLMMVMRNATTDSPWPVSNHPAAKYNDPSRYDCNLNIPLWQLIRASSAAPTYFRPEKVTMGDKSFLFVDGGITCYNNPAFQAFLMATAQPYRMNWATGEEKMLVVSVGTGSVPMENPHITVGDLHLLYYMKNLPQFLMGAASAEQDLLCRVFGRCLVGNQIDSEVGDLIHTFGPVHPKLFTYLRYNAELTDKGLGDLGLRSISAKKVQKLDAVNAMAELESIGKKMADKVAMDHFIPFL